MNQEILNFCLEKGLLVDKELLEIFNETQDVESIKLIIDRLKNSTNQNIITKNVLGENKEKVNQVFFNLPYENQRKLEKLKIKLGLSIEISKEVSNYSFNPPEQDSSKSGRVIVKENYDQKFKKLEVKDFVTHFRNRFSTLKNILQEHSELDNLISINKLSSNNRQQNSIIGIVTSKSITKNKNLIMEVEDLTGKIKVIVSQQKPELFREAQEICLDAVLGFRGSGNGQVFFANDIVFPDSKIPIRKHSNLDEYALFIGDFHFGSKHFLSRSFQNFLDYINGKLPNTPEVSKIKYLFIVGDLITGVGNYPNQEDDLEIHDLEEQYLGVSELLSKIPKHIKIIVCPGNHDGVRLMEPQPVFNEKYAWPLYNMENVIITPNPCYLNIGSTDNFDGFDVLTYHGFSFPYYANNVNHLILKKAMNSPEDIMKYLLKNRHLAPAHTSTQYFPHEDDALLIKRVPDIFLAGHTHKCGVTYYNNVLVISVACWEAMTPYQVKFGNEPDHAKVPIMNLKTRQIKILDFEDKQESEEKGA